MKKGSSARSGEHLEKQRSGERGWSNEMSGSLSPPPSTEGGAQADHSDAPALIAQGPGGQARSRLPGSCCPKAQTALDGCFSHPGCPQVACRPHRKPRLTQQVRDGG